jgi:hypothetical protein
VTTKEISDRIIARADDDATAPRSFETSSNSPVPPEILAAINEGQELASWLTLCLETTVALTLTASATFYLLRSQITDYLVPLRLTVAGQRVRPTTLAELDARNAGWQSDPGTPERYIALGFSFFGVHPQPVDDTAAQLTYARSSAQLVGDAFLELPEAFQPSLIDYGLYRVKLKEGAQSLERAVRHLNRFLDEMIKLGDYVRAKSRASRYDVLPFELALFDRSRLIEKLLKGKPPK